MDVARPPACRRCSPSPTPASPALPSPGRASSIQLAEESLRHRIRRAPDHLRMHARCRRVPPLHSPPTAESPAMPMVLVLIVMLASVLINLDPDPGRTRHSLATQIAGDGAPERHAPRMCRPATHRPCWLAPSTGSAGQNTSRPPICLPGCSVVVIRLAFSSLSCTGPFRLVLT